MPSTLPRVSVCLTPDQSRLLERLGGLQGRSQASYVRNLVDLAEPALWRLLTRLDGLALRRERIAAETDGNLEAAMDALDEEAASELDAQLDLVDMLDAVPATDEAQHRPAGGPPPILTGGSALAETGTKQSKPRTSRRGRGANDA